MKRFMLVAAVMTVATIGVAQVRYVVNGDTGGQIEGAKVYLRLPDFGEIPVDSTTVKDGRFCFKGETDMVRVAYVSAEGAGLKFITEPGTVSLSLATATMSGTPLNDSLAAFNARKRPLEGKMYNIIGEARALAMPADSAKMEQLKGRYVQLSKELALLSRSFILDNLDNVLPAVAIVSAYRNFNNSEMAEIDRKACPELKANADFMSVVSQRLAKVKPDEFVGKKYIDFRVQGLDGKPAALSDFVGHGKWVLVDFWASWCVPCRKEMPAVKAVYEKYKDRGFDVVGVSLDTNRNAWAKAVNQLGLPWHHISDLKGGPDSVSSAVYHVNAIPYTMLINPDGIIVATNLRGAEIEKRLDEAFK